MAPLSLERPLVLGSASPRRREILSSLGVPFIVRPVHTDEQVLADEDVSEYLPRVVGVKLAAALAAAEAAAVLVADTSVVGPAGAILGKPSSVDEAEAMIRRLSGRTHEVHTRFALAAGGALHEQTVVTEVTFREITLAEARAYALTGEGLDKAGGYALQGRAAAFVPRILGSYSNVVGLPACEVAQALSSLGLW